jgi:hypothetical protein
MSSPRETHISDLLPAYALNSLDTDEARQVANHLLTCDECYREFLAFQAVVDRLGYAASDMRPSPTLKGRLLSRIRTVDLPQAEAGSGIPWLKRLSPQRLTTPWLTAATVIVVLLVGNIWLAEELIRYASAAPHEEVSATPAIIDATLRTITLRSTSTDYHAKGMLLVSEDGRKGMLVVDGLPAISVAHVYQAWLGEKAQPNSGGILNVNDKGYGWVEINDPNHPLHEYRYFGVTVEPPGGSMFPTGDSILAAYR